MSVEIENFYPQSSYTISATASSSNTALTQPPNVAGSAGSGGGYTAIRISNPSTTVPVYAAWGNVSQTATATSPCVVAPGTTQTFEMGGPYTNLALIMGSAGTVVIYVMIGEGH